MENTPVKAEIKKIVKEIRKRELVDHFDIPEEFQNDTTVIIAERKAKMRVISTRGFDVIRQNFFVNELVNKTNPFDDEIIQKNITTTFGSFDEYYHFIDGKVYDQACYYGYIFSANTIKKYKLDISKMNFIALTDETLDSSIPEAIRSNNDNYEQIEKNKTNIRRWIKKYNACNTSEQLFQVNERHKKSTTDKTDESFYLWNYIFSKGDVDNIPFDVIMDFVNSGYYPAGTIEDTLPFLFPHDRLLASYAYTLGAESTCKRHKSQFKTYIKILEENGYYTSESKYFDKNTHYFCIRTDYHINNSKSSYPCASLYRYFEDFQSFTMHLNNDLSDCNLLNARGICIDSSFKTNENTIMPVEDINFLKKIVTKKYDRIRDCFTINVYWKNENNATLFRGKKTFRYFFDFLFFVKSDLSFADLIYCDGLKNLPSTNTINFSEALLTSEVSESLGISYKAQDIIKVVPHDFPYIIDNEKSTALILNDDHPEAAIPVGDNEISDNKVYYISDLHIVHTLIRKKAKSSADVICIIQRFIDNMLETFVPVFWSGCSTILIGGDISSEYAVFELFVQLLRRTLDENSYDVNVIFILGNHELWNYSGTKLTDIIQQYRDVLSKQKMFLLHDEILYIENHDNISYISKDEILKSGNDNIRQKVRKARLVLFGGIGFAGCNEEFNANNGIYRNTVTRAQEIELSSNFRNLYDHVIEALGDRKVIVFTHMGISEWANNYELHDNYVYVCGHSHKNAFYDDGSRRLYADNQVGYYNDRPRLKYFLVDDTYDWFVDYDDGIYEITRNEYIEFYRGKNIAITYNREINKLYMLKKNGYYCFIHENKNGKLTMLNGGALCSLSHKNIEYYYQNMAAEIDYIKTPLMKYQQLQKQISEEIRKLGGNGRIHGAIIDIDGTIDEDGWRTIAYNHLYINPIDLSITPYYAIDMVLKYVYPNFPSLLCDKCPDLYSKYNELITDKNITSIILKPVNNAELMVKPKLYTSTDIYKASRELRKMQKLNSNILSTWYDNSPNLVAIPEKPKSNEYRSAAIGTVKMMTCGMNATIIEYKNYNDISVKFDDGTIVEHVSKYAFSTSSIWNPNIEKPPKDKKSHDHKPYHKSSYLGKTQMMNCGMKATVIEDFGCNDITIQFEDGLIRKHKRRDKFREGKIAHCKD